MMHNTGNRIELFQQVPEDPSHPSHGNNERRFHVSTIDSETS